MNTPEKCPKCHAPVQPCLNAVVIQFQCGSMVDAGDCTWHGETTQCIVRQRDQLAERVKRLESVVTDPHALWSNWLRGDIQLPAGIGDIRECAEKMKRFRSRWLAAHKRMMEMENEAERASERVKRLEEAGRKLCKRHLLVVVTYPQAQANVAEYEKAIQ